MGGCVCINTDIEHRYKQIKICAERCNLVAADGNMLMAYTPNENHAYNYTWMAPASQHFAFEVQACNDVHLALSTTPGDSTQMTYEVVIGGYANTRSAHGDVTWHELAQFLSNQRKL